jgi:hypothetical protein
MERRFLILPAGALNDFRLELTLRHDRLSDADVPTAHATSAELRTTNLPELQERCQTLIL